MGDLIQAEGETMDVSTNSEADAQAILRAAIHCRQSNLNNIIIQTDSMLMFKVLKNDWQCPWALIDIKEHILKL